MTDLLTQTQMNAEDYAFFLAYGDEVYEELDAAARALLDLTILDVPEEGE